MKDTRYCELCEQEHDESDTTCDLSGRYWFGADCIDKLKALIKRENGVDVTDQRAMEEVLRARGIGPHSLVVDTALAEHEMREQSLFEHDHRWGSGAGVDPRTAEARDFYAGLRE